MVDRAERAGFKGALAHRDFRILLASLTTSGTGDWLYNVALVVLVLDTTGSPGWVAAASIGRLVPYVLFSPFGGALADRYGPRRMMIASDLARAALMGLLALVAVTSAPIIFAIAIAFLSTAAGTPFFPSVAATTPSVVDEKSLAPANGLISTVDSLSIALGPALGGVLLLLGPPQVAFVINALTFVVSAFLLSRLSAAKKIEIEEVEEQPPLTRQIADGVKALRRRLGWRSSWCC